MTTYIIPAECAAVCVHNGAGLWARAENLNWNNPESLHFVGKDIRIAFERPELEKQADLDLEVRRLFEKLCQGRKVEEPD